MAIANQQFSYDLPVPLVVPFQRLSPLATLPAYATAGAAGMDLTAALEGALTIEPARHALIPCGFAVALPYGYEAQIRPRSGLAAKFGVTVLNAPGTIDCDYRGEVKVLLINHGQAPFVVEPGMRIAQMVIAAVEQIAWAERETLPDTERGEGGFGHTGH